MCNEPAKNAANYSGPPIVQEQSSTNWILLWIFSMLIAIISGIVAGQSPACTAPSIYYPNGYYSYSYGWGYWYGGPYCYTTYSFLPPVLVTVVIVGSLNFAGLKQLVTTAPSEASSDHFCCMFTWAIVLGGNCLSLAIMLASIASVPMRSNNNYLNYYYCPSTGRYYYGSSYTTYSPFFASSTTNCETGRRKYEAWKALLISRSAFAHGFYAFSCWWLVIFAIIGIVVSSRVKYWCTDSCREGCQECTTGPEDDCNTCLCCLYPPGQGPTPKVGGTAVAMGPVGGTQGGVPLAVNQQPVMMQQQQPVMMQQQPVMGNEVQYWLTNELGLPQYVAPFVQNGYSNLGAVLYAFNTEADLRRVIPNVLPGHAAMILSNLQSKRQYAQPVPFQGAPVGGTVPNGEGVATR